MTDAAGVVLSTILTKKLTELHFLYNDDGSKSEPPSAG